MKTKTLPTLNLKTNKSKRLKSIDQSIVSLGINTLLKTSKKESLN